MDDDDGARRPECSVFVVQEVQGDCCLTPVLIDSVIKAGTERIDHHQLWLDLFDVLLESLPMAQLEIGDLVKGASTGKIGIVIGMADGFLHRVYYYVQFHDNTYTIHINNLELLETK